MRRDGLFYRFRVAIWLSALSLVSAADSVFAQQDLIVQCPVNEVSAEITTPLPEEWWNTPQLGRIVGAEVRLIGDEPVLTCLYKLYGREIAVMRRPPEVAPSCRVRPSGSSFVCGSDEVSITAGELQGKICQASIQNQIEWDYRGSKRWATNNLERICKNANDSLQPGVCFNRVMHGNINHGKGARWTWPHALRLCAGTRDANATIACFTGAIGQQKQWPQAIEQCHAKF